MAAPTTISFISLLTAALNLVRALIRRVPPLTPRQRAARAAHAARAASATGNSQAVNALAEQNRLDSTLLLPIFLSLLLLTGCGCSLVRARPRINKDTPPDPIPDLLVIPADRYQYLTTNSTGTVGWFVPLAVHVEMMEALALVSYYRSVRAPLAGAPSFNHS